MIIWLEKIAQWGRALAALPSLGSTAWFTMVSISIPRESDTSFHPLWMLHVYGAHTYVQTTHPGTSEVIIFITTHAHKSDNNTEFHFPSLSIREHDRRVFLIGVMFKDIIIYYTTIFQFLYLQIMGMLTFTESLKTETHTMWLERWLSR